MNKGTHARIPRSEMEPLKITAWLQCGVICDECLPIDGVLYYEAMREQYGDQQVTYCGQDHADRVPAAQLPLMRIDEETPMWYYAASFAKWSDPVAKGQDYWNKRVDMSLIDLVDWRGRKARIDVSSGEFKSYHMPVWYRHALSVDWYVVGHRQRIERLLSQVTNLGKKYAQGWGAVLRWDVEPAKEDWSVRGPDGRLMRARPAERGILTGFRPSYWLPKNQAICELPGRVA